MSILKMTFFTLKIPKIIISAAQSFVNEIPQIAAQRPRRSLKECQVWPEPGVKNRENQKGQGDQGGLLRIKKRRNDTFAKPWS
ncbi:MAG: hypothetical protein VB085_06000 [Peptococcaceae bacterium]|nr:hypothetical protein [Peptococcaceae bacterium]